MIGGDATHTAEGDDPNALKRRGTLNATMEFELRRLSLILSLSK